MNKTKTAVLAVLTCMCISIAVLGQTPTTATIAGTVRDSSQAVIDNADIVLTDISTNKTQTARSASGGQYAFVHVLPGNYQLQVRASGFKEAVVTGLKVDVAKSYLQNFTLTLGSVSDSVTVAATTEGELQTLDSTIGNVVKGKTLASMPSIDRSITSYTALQPLTSPQKPGCCGTQGGGVAGGRLDQNTWTLDGIDVSENGSGGGGNGMSVNGPLVSVPVDSIEEFRVDVSNANATLTRGSGAQFIAVRRRGSNSLHGAAYDYLQNSALNANSWSLGRLRVRKPHLEQNRFGARLGGPIVQDKTFFFGHYEGWRFPNSSEISRQVPTDSLKQGILRFTDASGITRDYDLASSTACGASANLPCDPRGLGISPSMSALFQQYPSGNNGTGPNSATFTLPADQTTSFDYGLFRLDHELKKDWNVEASFNWARTLVANPQQVDIGGVLHGDTIGKVRTVGNNPDRNHTLIVGVTGVLSPRLVNDFRFGWVYDTILADFLQQSSNVPQSNDLVALPALLSLPVDRNSRNEVHEHTYQFVENLTYTTGRNTIRAGFNVRRNSPNNSRTAAGPFYFPAATLDAQNFLTIPADQRPPTCSGLLLTNCLRPADVANWNSLYSAALGLTDNVSVLLVRDSGLNAQPFGTPLRIRAYQYSMDPYISVTSRITPNFTLSYGLLFDHQTPAYIEGGRDFVIVDTTTNKVVDPDQYLAAKRKAALAGDIYNPTLGFDTVSHAGRSAEFSSSNNFAPRIAAAWNPSGRSGFWGHVLGEQGTVLRGGFGVFTDRMPLLEVIGPAYFANPLFSQAISCNGPVTNGTCSATSTNPTTGFRVGVDGDYPVPASTDLMTPFVPSAPFAISTTQQIDPKFKAGRSYQANFTIQRELKGDFLLETGWVGRWGRNLQAGVNLNSLPYFMIDKVSNQTFAQAFNSVANQLRSGTAAASVSTQPWFENMLPSLSVMQGLGVCAPGTTSATNCLATNLGALFINDQLNNLWQNNIDVIRSKAGMEPVNNLQMLNILYRTDGAYSLYNGAFASLHKRMSHGLAFDFNYTLSRSTDQGSAVANEGIIPYANSFNPRWNHGVSYFDNTHVANIHGYYELPFGHSRSGWLHRLAGGWTMSGIWSAYSGLPILVSESAQAFGGGTTQSSFSFTPRSTGAIFTGSDAVHTGIHNGINGSGGVGTAGNPANGGTGINMFADPEAVFNQFRFAQVGEDDRNGRGTLRGLGHWNLDASFAKRTALTERINLLFSADIFNMFNHVEFNDSTLNINSPSTFGVLSSPYVRQFNPLVGYGNRAIQLALRLEF